MKMERSTELVALLAGLGIGAALMYLLDPDRGARRRSLIRDKAARASRVTGRELVERAHDVKNRAQGQVAALRGRFAADDQLDDDQLIARVRAELGHRVDQARSVEIVARDGEITIRGQVPPDGVDDIVAAVRSVRGVKQVNNELVIRPPSDNPSTVLH
jgi:osmotically-inducible protein OsmY